MPSQDEIGLTDLLLQACLLGLKQLFNSCLDQSEQVIPKLDKIVQIKLILEENLHW